MTPTYTVQDALEDVRRAQGAETPEETIIRLRGEVDRLTTEKLAWKRRALSAGWEER